MASVYLNTVNEERPSALNGVFEFTRVPTIGEIVQVIDQDYISDPVWFKVTSVVHLDRGRDETQVDAELFGMLMSNSESNVIWGILPKGTVSP